MRKSIFYIGILLVFACHYSYSQDTPNSKGKLVSKDAHWTNITLNLFDSSYVQINNFKIEGDTTIHATEYLKVYLNDKLYKGLRENEDHEVYMYTFFNNKEYLLYDFSWEIGDTLCYEPTYYIPPVVDSSEEYIHDGFVCSILKKDIDSVKLNDGQYYKYIPLGNSRFGDNINIKDIGRNQGIFSHMWEHPADGNYFAIWSFYNGKQLIYKLKGWYPYINRSNMKIIPESPTEADSIYLITDVVTDYGGQCLGYQVNESDTQINVEACYWKDLQTPWKEYVDTINLGRIKDGDYKVKFSAYVSDNGESCTPKDTNSVTMYLSVSPYSKIQPAEKQYEISCYPNPSTGKITFRIEQDPKPLKLLQIYSSNGRLVYSTAINNRKQIIVNKLPAGSYFYKFTRDNHRIYHSGQVVIQK